MDLFALQNSTQDLRSELAQAKMDVQALPIALREGIDSLWEHLSGAFQSAALDKQQLEGQLAQVRLRNRSKDSSSEAARQEGRSVSTFLRWGLSRTFLPCLPPSPSLTWQIRASFLV